MCLKVKFSYSLEKICICNTLIMNVLSESMGEEIFLSIEAENSLKKLIDCGFSSPKVGMAELLELYHR